MAEIKDVVTFDTKAYQTLVTTKVDDERPRDGEYVCVVRWHRGQPLIYLKERLDG